MAASRYTSSIVESGSSLEVRPLSCALSPGDKSKQCAQSKQSSTVTSSGLRRPVAAQRVAHGGLGVRSLVRLVAVDGGEGCASGLHACRKFDAGGESNGALEGSSEGRWR